MRPEGDKERVVPVENLHRHKPARLEPILTMEVCRGWDGRQTSVIVIASRPGREGTFQRRWQLVNGLPDVPQSVDISNWVLLTVKNALETSWGIQGVLKM